VKPLVLPARSPNLNAFVEHYHEERPHQGLGNELIAPKTTSIGTGAVTCRARLGGLLKFYDREAA
jgi:putative transposase